MARAIELVENYFGKEWLREQAKDFPHRPREPHRFTHHIHPEPHPVLPIFLSGIENLKRLNDDQNVGFEIKSLELMSFSDALREIEKIGVVNSNGELLSTTPWNKLRERLKNKEEFRQVSYEIQIAAALRKSGLTAYFIQESRKPQEKTPDLLIKENQNITYVECKFRAITDRERNYGNMFNEFYWRAMRSMYRLGKFYLICVEWLEDPTIENVVSLVLWLEERITNGEQGYFQLESTKIWLKLLAFRGEIFQGPFNIDVGQYRSDSKHADIMMQHMELSGSGILEGKVEFKEPTFVMFRNISYLDDLADGIVGSINKAYSQIPEKGPSVIFLETRLSFGDQKIKESLEDLQTRVERKLGLIGRVNIIVLTKSYFDQRNIRTDERNGVRIRRMIESRLIPNPKPDSAIPEDVQNTVKNLKYY